RRHTRFSRDWSSDVCSSDLERFIARLNNQLTLGDKLKANFDLSLNRSLSNNPTSNPINSAHKYAPIYAARWSDGRIAGGKDGSKIGRASCREAVEATVGGVA